MCPEFCLVAAIFFKMGEAKPAGLTAGNRAISERNNKLQLQPNSHQCCIALRANNLQRYQAIILQINSCLPLAVFNVNVAACFLASGFWLVWLLVVNAKIV